MSTEIVHQITTEEWEYKNKSSELSRLETMFTQKELELATFRGDINSFQVRYLAAVGFRYWELDKIQAEIAEIEASQKPHDHRARKRAEQARAQAEESAKFAGNQDKVRETAARFKPTESLKKLYRLIAKQVHPDLAVDDQERSRYQQLMAKANQAYQAGDELGLQNILRQVKKSSFIEKNDNINDKLIRIRRQLIQVKERIVMIEKELAELRNSTLYQLKLQVETADTNGSDLLLEMAKLLDQQIAVAKANLARIKAKGNEIFVS